MSTTTMKEVREAYVNTLANQLLDPDLSAIAYKAIYGGTISSEQKMKLDKAVNSFMKLIKDALKEEV